MYRSISDQLSKWKNSPDRKPLLITGIRQSGKTYALQEFGRNNFEETAYFYFEGNQGLSSVFDFDLDTARILNELRMISGKNIIPGRTLVIFDEIQACPRAITALKYFCEMNRGLHIACAGSLLGVSIKRDGISFPVGKVDLLRMYPMDFYEFLCAEGKQSLCESVLTYAHDRELPQIYTCQLQKELKYYYIVGGMPEAVDKWTKSHSFEDIDLIQQNILDGYSGDFAKYAPARDIPKLGWIWDSVPKQLAKENNKFVFSHVRQGKRSAELEDALEWLADAGLVYRLELAATPELPLSFYANAVYFKVYMADVGLLRRKSGVPPETILEENALYSVFKGAFTENYVLTELLSAGIHPYFWRSGNTAELDFIFEDNGRVIPMEVKAEFHTRAKSYLQFCERYKPPVGFRCSMKNMGVNTVGNTMTFSLPLYLLWNIKSYLQNR